MKTKDLQNKIIKIMLRKNPNATVGMAARNYKSLKKYILGENNV